MLLPHITLVGCEELGWRWAFESSVKMFGCIHLPFGIGGNGSSYRIFSTSSDTVSEKNGGFPEITWISRISLSSTLIPNLTTGIPGEVHIHKCKTYTSSREWAVADYCMPGKCPGCTLPAFANAKLILQINIQVHTGSVPQCLWATRPWAAGDLLHNLQGSSAFQHCR